MVALLKREIFKSRSKRSGSFPVSTPPCVDGRWFAAYYRGSVAVPLATGTHSRGTPRHHAWSANSRPDGSHAGAASVHGSGRPKDDAPLGAQGRMDQGGGRDCHATRRPLWTHPVSPGTAPSEQVTGCVAPLPEGAGQPDMPAARGCRTTRHLGTARRGGLWHAGLGVRARHACRSESARRKLSVCATTCIRARACVRATAWGFAGDAAEERVRGREGGPRKG